MEDYQKKQAQIATWIQTRILFEGLAIMKEMILDREEYDRIQNVGPSTNFFF